MSVDRELELGALWTRTTGRGDQMLTGHLTVDGQKIDIVVFANGFKDSDRKPDWRIYKSKPRDGAQPARQQPPARQSIADDLGDEIPFAWVGALLAPALALLTLGGLT